LLVVRSHPLGTRQTLQIFYTCRSGNAPAATVKSKIQGKEPKLDTMCFMAVVCHLSLYDDFSPLYDDFSPLCV
jgi:hypothetical protein